MIGEGHSLYGFRPRKCLQTANPSEPFEPLNEAELVQHEYVRRGQEDLQVIDDEGRSEAGLYITGSYVS